MSFLYAWIILILTCMFDMLYFPQQILQQLYLDIIKIFCAEWFSIWKHLSIRILWTIINVFVTILFVLLEFIFPLENFSLICRRHHCRWRAANFDLCSTLIAIEQWEFFNVPHPLRHGPFIMVIFEDPGHP